MGGFAVAPQTPFAADTSIVHWIKFSFPFAADPIKKLHTKKPEGVVPSGFGAFIRV